MGETLTAKHRAARSSSGGQVGDWLSAYVAEQRSLQPQEVLTAQQSPASLLFRVGAGVLAGVQCVPGGNERIVAFYCPGDLVVPGLPRAAWTVTVTALTATSVEVFELDRLRDAGTLDRSLGFGLFEVACRDLSHRLEQAARMRGLTVEGRLAAFLIEIGRRIGTSKGRGLDMPVPMSRSEIANYLGLRTETVCRVIGRWKRAGVLHLDGPRVIRIRDLADLELLAEDRATA